MGVSNMKVVYMCHGGFKNTGFRERPLTKYGGGGAGFHMWPTRDKSDFGAKNNKNNKET